ncbi:glycoside hydrolase family 2 protein [Chitinophaga horti]|uniref:Beta-mannosidase B n=1 Tax=Chitinophaga horti TaxID=2920382 RepID=A0ABY6J032_9BACT|nr:glycoside hydrolase family 2 protein [Chitinophaga horti]UYQ92002.1 glycoside hydrolase family 2 protein [Chitinophaga horti]
MNTLSAQTQRISLHNGWEFRRLDEQQWRPATVPGTVHTDLLNNKLIPDPFFGTNEKGLQWLDKLDWEYRCQVAVPASLLAQPGVELVTEGLDTYAEVFVNDQPVMQTQNMFVARKASVKQFLKAGANEIRIRFKSPTKTDMPKFLRDGFLYPAGNDQMDIPLSVYARKAPYHYGWDWGPRLVTSGIWRPVYLQATGHALAEEIWVKQLQLNDKKASMAATATVDVQQSGKYRLVVHSPEKAFKDQSINLELAAGKHPVNLPFEIGNPQRWWPSGLGAQKLYNVQVSLLEGRDTLSAQTQRIGLRTIEIVNKTDAQGESFFVKVNGVPVFMKGANYIPQDNFLPRVTDERYRKLFSDMKTANFNMVRVWGGGIYENDLFYDLADENGILVWQDFMFACSLYPSDKDFLAQVQAEADYNIKRLRTHASLALWCGNNEVGVAIKNWGWKEGYGYTDENWKALLAGYDKLFKDVLPAAVKANDPERFYFHSSPISNWGTPQDFTKGDNHYWGVWHGMEWFDAYETHIPRFMSEYGFQSFPDLHSVRRFANEGDYNINSFVMMSHQRSTTRGNAAIRTYMLHYYKEPASFASFLYVNHLLQAEGVRIGMEAHRRAMPYCMGTLYWQVNDCWPAASWSGIDYYGRWKALHYYAKKAFEPLLVSNTIEKGQLNTYIVSDLLKDEKLQLEASLMDFDGKVLWRKTIPVTAKANSSAVHYRIAPAELLKGADTSRVIFYTKLIKNGQFAGDNLFYFAKPKSLSLGDPGLQTEVNEKNGVISVTLHPQRLAKNVFLFLDTDNTSHFSDNYFDIVPNEKKTVILTTNKTLQQVRDGLKVQTLRDADKQ